jgi:hypothetical protein
MDKSLNPVNLSVVHHRQNLSFSNKSCAFYRTRSFVTVVTKSRPVSLPLSHKKPLDTTYSFPIHFNIITSCTLKFLQWSPNFDFFHRLLACISQLEGRRSLNFARVSLFISNTKNAFHNMSRSMASSFEGTYCLQLQSRKGLLYVNP